MADGTYWSTTPASCTPPPSADLSPESITAQLATNLVAPTLLAQAALREWQLSKTPPARIGHPEEVAWAITQLASPAASFVTGVVLPVDGGAVVA